MKKSESKTSGKLLLDILDLADNLALKMFQADNPQASKPDFEASVERPRYLNYANVAILELATPE